MKKMVEVEDVGDPLVALMGESVLFLCANYFYYGKLTGVNDTCIEITDPKIVYETGAWDKAAWSDAQKLPAKTLIVNKSFIESYMQVSR